MKSSTLNTMLSLFADVNDQLFESYVIKAVRKPEEVLENGFIKKLAVRKDAKGNISGLKKSATSLPKHIRGKYKGTVFLSTTNPYYYKHFDFVKNSLEK